MSADKNQDKEPWLNHMALATVVLAVCATLSTFKGGGYSTQSVILQGQASDQWSFYQAKSIKEHLQKNQADLLRIQLSAEARPSHRFQQFADLLAKAESDVKRYATEKEQIAATARQLETARDEAKISGRPFGYAVILLQIAILLNSISGLLKKKPIWWASIPVGLSGIVLFADGFLRFITW